MQLASFFEWLTTRAWANFMNGTEWAFWAKMALLALVGVYAVAFRKAVYENPKRLDAGLTPPAKLAAILSLILWAGLIMTDRMIGFEE